jgi:outer membrane protein insertion porin family
MQRLWRNLALVSMSLAWLASGCSSWSGSSNPNAPVALYPWPGQQPVGQQFAAAPPGYAPAASAVSLAPAQASPAPVQAAPQPVVRAQNGAYGGWPVQPVGPEARATQTVAQAGNAPAGPYTSYQGGGPFAPPPVPAATGAPNGIPAQPVSMMGPFDYSIPSEIPPNSLQQDPYIDLEAYAQETQTGKFQIGAAVNSDAGLVGQIVLDEQNFDLFRWPSSWEDIRNGTAWRGAGQRFRLEAMPGTDVQRYVASFTEPYFLNSPFSLGLSGSFFDRVYTDWTETRAGGRVQFGYQFPEVPDLSTALAFRGERVKVSNISQAVHNPPTNPPTFLPVELTDMEGDNDLFGFGVSVKHDTRDHAFLPTQGHLIEMTGEFVTGTFDYPRATFDGRQYFVVRERPDSSGRHTLAFSGKLGFSGPDTPTYENFFAGGFSTLRGFDFRGASPRVFQEGPLPPGQPRPNVIIGGPFEMLGSVEYMFPITADDNLRGVVFTDFGTVEQDVRIDPNTFRVSVGFGLRIVLAQALGPAPIALDLAVPVAHAAGDDIQNFSFFVGYSR